MPCYENKSLFWFVYGFYQESYSILESQTIDENVPGILVIHTTNFQQPTFGEFLVMS